MILLFATTFAAVAAVAAVAATCTSVACLRAIRRTHQTTIEEAEIAACAQAVHNSISRGAVPAATLAGEARVLMGKSTWAHIDRHGTGQELLTARISTMLDAS